MTVLLETDDGASLELDNCDAGYLVQQVEVGAPEVRTVAENRTMTDGTWDRTRFVGARAISINLRLASGPSARVALLDALAPFLHPARRLWLTIGLDPEVPRTYRVRPDDWSGPWERPSDVALTVSWRTADTPWAMSRDISEVTLSPAGAIGRGYDEAPVDATTGRVYDRDWPFAASSIAPVINAGTAPADWQANVHGPMDGFTLRNITTGDQLAFPGLDIPAGQFIALDSVTHTVLAEGEPGSSRYSYIDFATSSWFRLRPGLNQMTITSQTYSAPAQTVMRWRNSFVI